jgi:Skp family chaperone for outer membrane proteins
MFTVGITLLTALLLSAVAAYFSIAGLMAIFSSAVIPIAVMGGTLELAKIVTASWLYRNWKTAPILFRYYLVSSTIILSLITSLGIFGYLSKAHNDQNLVSGDVQSKIAIYDEKIKTARENIEANRKQLKQMDEAVDQVMGRSTDEKGADKAVSVRRNQSRDRNVLAKDIEANQKLIATLNDEAAPIRAEVRKVEAEVGPIKYIAALIYTEQTVDVLEKAVRWVIIALVIVFDPLAILLLIAANMSLRNLQTRPESIIPLSVFDPPATSALTPDSGVINIPKEFPDVFASQYSYPQPEKEEVVTETPKPKETWSEILYRRAGLTKK